jgi:hypothetical protein
MTNEKKKRVRVGVIKKSKDNDSFYLSLGQGVELVKDGKVLSGVVNISLQNPVERREAILKSPKVTNPDQLKTEIEQYSKGGKLEFIKFEAFAAVED